MNVHNTAATILLVNAFLGFFYYVTTGEIRQLIPQSRNLLASLWSQARYYGVGIFRGEPHPHLRLPASRLNPLQRITYILVLNILLPLQVVTGLAMAMTQRLGAMPVLAYVHTLGAWLFSAFLLLHLYLITTGRTPASNLKSMLTGWEAIEMEAPQQEAGSR